MKETNMLLIHPPAWHPDHPYTALPHLKGYAREHGYHLEITDAALDFFDDIFTREFLEPYVDKALADFADMDNGCVPYNPEIFSKLRLISIYSDELRTIDSWKNVLRADKNPETAKFVYHIFNAAFNTLEYSFDMQKFWFSSIKSNKYNLSLIDDILNYVHDTKENIFYHYYANGNGRKLIKKAAGFQHVGFSVTLLSQLAPALTMASLMKKENKDVIIHFGGAYTTALTHICASEEVLPKLLTIPDFLVLNEGEITLEKIWEGRDFHDCPNVVWLKEGKIFRAEKCNYISKEPVLSNFDDFDLDRYFLSTRVLPIVTGHGCYNDCAFCSRLSSFCNNYHGYNMTKLIENIHLLKEKYHASCFFFNDEVFNLKRMVQFSRLLKEEKVTWLVETRLDEQLSDEEINTIVEGGCRMLMFGMESYNQRVLDLMKKNVPFENIDPLVNGFIQHGVMVTLFGIFGFPGETEDEMKNTMRYLLDVKKRMEKSGYYFGGSAFGSYVLLEGSDVYSNPKDYGIEIIPNPSGSVLIEHEYRFIDGKRTDSSENIIQSLEINNECRYEDFISLDYVLFNPNQINADIKINDKIFVNHRDLSGKEREFKYFYNYQLQLLVPIENPAFERALKSVYGHESGEPFDENAKFILNPYVVIDDFVHDSITKKKFRVDSVNISLLKKIESEKEISGKDLTQSERALLPRLLNAGFILQL